MTHAEALNEAQQRWGVHAFAYTHISDSPQDLNLESVVYEVGETEYGGYQAPDERHVEMEAEWDHTYGSGDSWEAAFADADRRDTGRDR